MGRRGRECRGERREKTGRGSYGRGLCLRNDSERNGEITFPFTFCFYSCTLAFSAVPACELAVDDDDQPLLPVVLALILDIRNGRRSRKLGLTVALVLTPVCSSRGTVPRSFCFAQLPFPPPPCPSPVSLFLLAFPPRLSQLTCECFLAVFSTDPLGFPHAVSTVTVA